MRRSRLGAAISAAATCWIAVFWLGCVALPLVTLLGRVRGAVPLFDPVILRIAWVTFAQAGASAAIAAAVALPLGAWVGSRAGRGSVWAEYFLALPFGVPTVVAGLAWVIVLGRSGWLARAGLGLDWAYTWKAVILAHVFFNIPWIALWVAQARRFVPEIRLEAARTLGAGALARFRFVVWPQVRWAFLGACCQAWVFCALSFALVLGLGGGPPVQTLETELYSRMRFAELDLPGAIACAIWELAVTLVPWLLFVLFQSLHDRDAGSQAERHERSAAARPQGGLAWAAVAAALLFVPYLAVFAGGGGRWDLLGASLGGELARALRISAGLAFLAAGGSVLTAICGVIAVSWLPETARLARAAALFFLGLPSGISALVIGLGLWLSYRGAIDPFEGSPTAIVLVQVAIFFPIAFRVFWPVARERPARLLEAAASLGASPLRAFLAVEWPRWKLPLFSALGMVAAASLGEVAAVSLFYSEKLIPLPLLLSRWMSQYRFAEAQAAGGLLLVLCAGTIGGVFIARMGKEECIRG